MSVAGSFLLLLHLWPVVHLPPIDTCVNVCVFPRERDSLFHMLRWHPWCRRGRGVFGGAVRVFTSVMIACNHCPPLLLPLLPSTKTLVLSASALRSRCGISQRTKLQSDQLFKLQVSASGETRCSCVYLVFAHLFFVFFFPSLQVAKNALKKPQKLRVKYELTEVYEMYECVWSIGKGPSFSLWGSQAWCFHALHIKRAGTPRHQSVKHRRRLLPFSSERSSVCFMEQWLQGGRFVHLLFSELENLDTDLLKKSLQMWGGKKPLEMNCGAAVYICHWY